MHVVTAVAWGMLAVGLFGLLTSTVFLGMVLVGTARFRRMAREQEWALRSGREFLPGVSLFKPLHGAEPELEENLRSFYRQDYGGWGAGAGVKANADPSLRSAQDDTSLAEVEENGELQEQKQVLRLPRRMTGEEGVQEDTVLMGAEEPDGMSRVEVLFCARSEADAGLAIARRVAAEFPGVTTRFVTSGEPWAANAKVCSLAAMAKAATHDLWVISDSDVRVTPEYLRRVVLPFVDPKVGCTTCLYRGAAVEGGLWSRLEAVGMTIEMSSGVCVANLMEPMQFALGPTMAARRECVAEVGGFEAMAEYCSDDFLLGNWIAAKGHEVALSGHAIDHLVLYAGFLDSMKHQVRWMKSTRFSRPKGHFGTALTFGMPFGLLTWAAALLLHRPVLAWSVLAASVLGRSLQAWVVGRFVVRKRRLWPTMLLFPVRDFMGMFFWALSYTSNRILWRGEVYELVEGGRMRKAAGGKA